MRAWPIRRPILGLWSTVPQNARFPALDADEQPCKKLTPLVLSSADKSVTVQTQNFASFNSFSRQQKTFFAILFLMQF